MKKIISVIGIVLLMFTIVGCSSEVKDAEKSKSSTTEMEKTDDDKDVKESKEEESVAIKLDSSLTGMELLASIPIKMTETYISVTESVAADGTVATSKMYSKDASMRTESLDSEGAMQVSIYNDDLGVTWMYSEGEEFGMASYDEEYDESDDTEPILDGTYADLYAEEDFQNFDAKIEKLDGDDMIFISFSEDDGAGGTIDMKMWLSTEYGAVMQYEMYMNGAVVVSSKVIEFDADAKIDDSLFEEPEGIEFMEY